MRIVQCKTNHIVNPLGYFIQKPVFSWKVENAVGKRQSWARICVSKQNNMDELCYDSGMLEEADSLAFAAEFEISPRTRYYWTVTVQSDKGEEATSDVNWFETGKGKESWLGKWITCKKKNRVPIFEKRIQMQGNGSTLEKARLYICGLGLYEAFLDGKKISEEYFTPYCNNYDEWVQYQSFDVTELLQDGGLLSVMLGDGWAVGRMGYFSKPGDESNYGKKKELIAELHLYYTDGTHQIIGTDENWAVRRGKITASNIYDGEYYDSTLTDTKPEPVMLTEEKAKLTERYSLPVLIQEKLKPVKLIHTPAGEEVLDLGQNMSGIFRLRVKEKAGTKIYLQFGEVLQRGNFYRDNLRTALAEYTYICDGTEAVIEPHFTFFGYRYVKVQGVTSLKAEDFTGLVMFSDLISIGEITTGHEKVNRLIQNVKWGLKGNFLDVPTDCPQRDERLGWTGDAQVFAPTACFMRESYAFYRKYLHDMETEQRNLDGMVPDFIPSFHYVDEVLSAWGDAACIIPWTMYLFYGDKSILEEQFDSMKAWVEYVRRIDGEEHGWRKQNHLGDWLALDHPAGGADQCRGGTDEGYIADIYYAYSAEILGKAARVLGRTEDSEKYKALSEKIREGIREEYFSATGRCCVNTQTGLLLALRHNMAPNPEKCREMLASLFKKTKGKLKTGFIGSPILCIQLAESGMETLAYDLLLNEEYPGWLYEVNLGATTIWERWNSLEEDGTVSSTGMNSFNHYAYGSIVEWMFRHIAGLNPIEGVPGFREVEIKPVPDGRIDYGDMCYDSAAGCYKISWKVLDIRQLAVSITIPFGCSARVILPYAPEEIFSLNHEMFQKIEKGACILEAGHYEIAYETTRDLRKVYSIRDKVSVLEACVNTRKLVTRYIPHIFGEQDSLKEKSLKELTAFRFPECAGVLEELDEKLRKTW